MSRASGRSWLGPALAVALVWAPLPGMAAVWLAVRAEQSRDDGPEAFGIAARRARAWVVGAVLFGAAELAAFGGVGFVRWLLAPWWGPSW